MKYLLLLEPDLCFLWLEILGSSNVRFLSWRYMTSWASQEAN